jgi:serine/threonine protein phosphatase PrpC
VVAGRASIVGAAASHVGKVREHNEDAHFFDADAGVFLVCDGMGGHAAGEVASAIAIQTIRGEWSSPETAKVADAWLEAGTPDAKKHLLGVIRAGVLAAHDAIIAEAARDEAKSGMGTTLVGAVTVGNELVFAHAGDSRAYIVRDAIAMQLTEDHTLLARLLAAGIDVDVSGEGARFRSMLTNALGIGQECKVSTFVVPLADGDRFLFCSDGISEYVKEFEVGEVLSKQPSPARAAGKLIEMALERGGGDNATAIVIRVLEAGETPQPAEQIRRDNDVIASCPLWTAKITPQQRLRALRIAIPREYGSGERLPAHTLGDRVAWIVVEGELVQEGGSLGAGTLVYPESLVTDSPPPDREGLAVARGDVRALALRADDFRELCEDDSELGEALLEGLAPLIAKRRLRIVVRTERSDRADTEIDTETSLAALGMEAPASSIRPTVPIAMRVPIRAPTPPPLPAIDDPAAPEPQTPPGLIAAAPTSRSPEPRTAPAPIRPTPVPARATPIVAPVAPTRPTPVPAAVAPARPTPVPRPAWAEGKVQAPNTRDDEPVDSELEARFDAMFTPGAPPVSVRPSTERIPLILKSRVATEPGVATSLDSITMPQPRRAATEPSMIAIPAPKTIPRVESDPGSITTPRTPIRPPTDPEIETYIELEAEPPPLGAEADPKDEVMSVSVRVEDEALVTETVFDTSSATLTVTVTEPPIPDTAFSGEEEPTKIRPLTPVPERPISTAGAAKDEPVRRPKRLSDGWEE